MNISVNRCTSSNYCTKANLQPTFEYGFLAAPFALSVNPAAQIIVTINCNVPGSKPNFNCIRPPIFGSINNGPPGVKRFAYRVELDDVAAPRLISGEPGDVTKTLGLSRRSYVSKTANWSSSFKN